MRRASSSTNSASLFDISSTFIDFIILLDLIRFSLPQYEREGKAYLTIAIGCTGGQHRSVAIAEDVAKAIRDLDYRVTVFHRDAERNRALLESPR